MNNPPPTATLTETAEPRPLLHGIDVSDYQGAIDWHAVAAAGKSFAWTKLTEGVTVTAHTGATNLRGAAEAGMLAGGYHFLVVTSPAEEQARHFIEHLPPGLTLPPMIDVERSKAGGNPGAAAVLVFARVVEEGLRARAGEAYVRPWIYCSPSYAVTYLRGALALKDYHLVIAHYGVAAPTIPPPWTTWAAWQHTGDGACPGIRGAADLDCLRTEALEASRATDYRRP